jgi:hypothetical protein
MMEIRKSDPKIKFLRTFHISYARNSTKVPSQPIESPNMTIRYPLPPSPLHELNRPTATIPDKYRNGGTTATTSSNHRQRLYHQHYVIRPKKHTRNTRIPCPCLNNNNTTSCSNNNRRRIFTTHRSRVPTTRVGPTFVRPIWPNGKFLLY